MARIQVQKGSFIVSLPPHVAKFLEATKGTEIEYNITKNGKVEIKKIKEELK